MTFEINYNIDYPLLTAEEELDLIKRSQSGDTEAEKILVERNIKTVVKFVMTRPAYKYYPSAFQDLLQLGLIGLITGIRKFNTESGWRLSTYASNWIKQVIDREAQQGSFNPCMQHPVHHTQVANVLKAAIANEDWEDMTYDNCYELYCREMNKRGSEIVFGIKQIRSSFDYMRTSVAYGSDKPSYGGEDGDIELLDTLSYSDVITTEEEIDHEKMKERLWDLFERANLNPRERDIIRLRFGLGIKEELTLERIGMNYGLTRERIRQIEAIALKKLKRCINLEQLNLQDFLS